MASSRTPLLADDQRSSIASAHDDDDDEEETTTLLLGGLATSSPTRPFATSIHPTLCARGVALVLAVPAFIIFVAHGAHYTPAIVFLSFAIARQLAVLGSHFGSRIVVVRIEVVHPRLRGVSARAQEAWIKKLAAAVTDGVVLLGLLVSLSLVAHEVDRCRAGCPSLPPPTVTHAVILGFLTFGLLLVSVPDFGNATLVTLAVAVEKPVAGVVTLTTSVLYGEPDETEGDTAEARDSRRSQKSKPRRPLEDTV